MKQNCKRSEKQRRRGGESPKTIIVPVGIMEQRKNSSQVNKSIVEQQLLQRRSKGLSRGRTCGALTGRPGRGKIHLPEVKDVGKGVGSDDRSKAAIDVTSRVRKGRRKKATAGRENKEAEGDSRRLSLNQTHNFRINFERKIKTVKGRRKK